MPRRESAAAAAAAAAFDILTPTVFSHMGSPFNYFECFWSFDWCFIDGSILNPK